MYTEDWKKKVFRDDTKQLLIKLELLEYAESSEKSGQVCLV